MALWDIIRDFFVVYVFGGFDSQLIEYGGLIGYDPSLGDYYPSNVGFNFIYYTTGDRVWISLGDYLSTIATIITLVVILLFCIFFIKKIIGVMFRLFTFGV